MRYLLVILTILCTMNMKGNTKEQPSKVRPMAVAGQFYSADKGVVEKDLSGFFAAAPGPSASGASSQGETLVKAVIVPHAGYVFSGAVAAAAYARIDPDEHYDHIILIGPSHHVYLDGASVNDEFDYYQTPLGKVKVDKTLCESLVRKDCFTYEKEAHRSEHCLEVQLPFLQYHLRQMPPIVPIIIGTQDFKTIRKIATALKPYWDGNNLFVISSDFSHYPSYDDACRVDAQTGDAIMTGDVRKFVTAISDNEASCVPNLATSACGQCAIATLLLMMDGDSTLKINHILYRNSGDSSYGGKDEVVGYHAFTVTASVASSPSRKQAFSFSEEQKQTLLRIARKSIASAFDRSPLKSAWEDEDISGSLSSLCGAFVTLNENDSLRGCIGHFGSDIPVYQVVAKMARAAAFEDPRFPEVRKGEMPLIKIEISVLTPLKPIASADEFIYRKQGIYMVLNGRSGTFLPQVADEVDWTKEEFLGHCARDKAGIGWDGWKKAQLFTYEAIIFKE